MSIQVNDNANVMAQILQDNTQSRIAQQSEPESVPVQSVSSVDEITQSSVSVPQVDTVEISEEGQAAVERMYERMASRAAAAENSSESEAQATVAENLSEPETQAQATAPAQERVSGNSVDNSGESSNAPMQSSLKVSESKKEATTTTSAPVTSSSDDDSVNVNELYQYTEAQLATFLRKGLISRAQYDSEIARRNSPSTPKTDATGLVE